MSLSEMTLPNLSSLSDDTGVNRQVAPNWYVSKRSGFPTYGKAPTTPLPLERNQGRFCGACRDAFRSGNSVRSLVCWVGLGFLVLAVGILVTLATLLGRISDPLFFNNTVL